MVNTETHCKVLCWGKLFNKYSLLPKLKTKGVNLVLDIRNFSSFLIFDFFGQIMWAYKLMNNLMVHKYFREIMSEVLYLIL